MGISISRLVRFKVAWRICAMPRTVEIKPSHTPSQLRRQAASTKVGPYLGLTPRQHQSGESEWIGGVGRTSDPLLRSYLNEAAGVLTTRVRRAVRSETRRSGSSGVWDGSAPRSPLRVSWPSSCTRSGEPAPDSSGKLQRHADQPRPSFRKCGRRPMPGRRADDLVAIVAGHDAPRG